jgi:Zn-finger nucleic acid-binding protein
MKPQLVGQTTVDVCESCCGIWFDGGELERVIGRPLLARGSFPQYRRCPHCHEEMKRVVIGKVGVERCPTCGGHFLDNGELEQLVGPSRKAPRLEAPAPAAALSEDAVRDFDCMRCGGRFPIEKGYAVPGGHVCDRCSGLTSEAEVLGPLDKFLDALGSVLCAVPRAMGRESWYLPRRRIW